MRSSAHPAPLASWCIALLMVLALLAVFLHWMSTPGLLGDLPLLGKFRAQVEDFFSVPPAQRDRPRGVMLASSGALCAVTGPLQLSDDGPDLLVLPFPIATFDDFIPLVERLAALRPDFIIIQSAVLVDSTPLSYEYNFFVGNLNYRIRKDVLGKTPGVYPELNPKRLCNDEKQPTTFWRELESKLYDKLSDQHSQKIHARIYAALGTLARAGIPVMIVGVPRYEITAKYGEALMAKSRKLIKSAPSPIERVTFHAMAELFPETQFIDPLHVMSSVRQNYRTWLRTEIRKALHPP